MSLITRTQRYLSAFSGIGGLNRLTNRTSDSRKLVQQTFGYCDGYLAPIQVEDEIVQLVDEVKALKPRRILEIGTHLGGTLYLWTRVADEDALIISVDLPGGKFGGGYSRVRTPLYQKFARARQNLVLVRGNSHTAETAQRVKDLLSGDPLDFLFIDGDHTYDGVRQDWQMYSPLVRSGGLIALHDVAANYKDTEVKRLWDEIKGQFASREYLAGTGGLYGIGVLTK